MENIKTIFNPILKIKIFKFLTPIKIYYLKYHKMRMKTNSFLIEKFKIIFFLKTIRRKIVQDPNQMNKILAFLIILNNHQIF